MPTPAPSPGAGADAIVRRTTDAPVALPASTVLVASATPGATGADPAAGPATATRRGWGPTRPLRRMLDQAARRLSSALAMGLSLVVLAGLTGIGTLAAAPAWARTTTHVLKFNGAPPGQPAPTGSFSYDPETGRFEDFRVTYKGVVHDLTAAANVVGGHTVLPFELGTLGQNLVDGFGPQGLESAHWYATADAFIGFQWRAPATGAAADGSTFALTPLGPDSGLDNRQGVHAGTWVTTARSPSRLAMWWLLVAGVVLAALSWPAVRRLRKPRTMSFDEFAQSIPDTVPEPPPPLRHRSLGRGGG